MSEADSSPRVFISYSHDSAAHAKKVLKLAEALKLHGIHPIIDQEVKYPREGWPKWMLGNITDLHASDFVLLVCTKEYNERFMGRGEGNGVTLEGHLIMDDLYEKKMINERYLPIGFSENDLKYIPTLLRSYDHYQIELESQDLMKDPGFQKLISRICQKFPKTCLIKVLVLNYGMETIGETSIATKFKAINRTLAQHFERNIFDFIIQNTESQQDIGSYLNDLRPTIIHFTESELSWTSSSAQSDPNIPSRKKLRWNSTDLGLIFSSYRENQLSKGVIIQADYSLEQAKAIAENIPFVIGVPSGLCEELIIDFLTNFYKKLQDMKEVDIAFTDSTLALYANHPQLKDQMPILLEIRNGDLVEYDDEEKLKRLKAELDKRELEAAAVDIKLKYELEVRDKTHSLISEQSANVQLVQWLRENKQVLLGEISLEVLPKTRGPECIIDFREELDIFFDLIDDCLISEELNVIQSENLKDLFEEFPLSLPVRYYTDAFRAMKKKIDKDDRFDYSSKHFLHRIIHILNKHIKTLP